MPEEYMAALRVNFPEDLESDTQGHYMLITARGTGSDSPMASVALFVPGASSGTNIEFGTRIEYNEKKISQIPVEAVSNIPIIGTALAGGIRAAAGAAPLFGGAINPKVEVLYRDTGLRTFQYTFILAPTSDTESQSIKDIIKILRIYSSPTQIGGTSNPRAGYIGASGQKGYLSTGGIFLTPNEWTIEFYYRNESGYFQENLNIPKIGRCVLEAIDVMYNPNAEWSTFKDGNPVATQIAVQFREMRVIDSQNVAQGY